MKKIIFTGGGSGGHVLPAITLINKLSSELNASDNELDILYIGGKEGIERDLICNLGLKYKGISTGKLRRYFSVQNFLDLFKIFWGFLESFFIILNFKNGPTLLIGTGGFVSVAPVIAAKLLGLKVIIHEQTSRAGLANRLCSKFADKILISYEASSQYFDQHKVFFTGLPLRDEIFSHEINDLVIEGIALKNVQKPILFLTGGGNGSLLLNNWLKNSLNDLEKKYFVVHQVGKQFIDEFSKLKNESYLPISFVNEGMIDLFKLSTFVISRAGANTVLELYSLGKKSILVPLKIAQKNEQFHNAKFNEEKLGSIIIEEDKLNNVSLDNILKSLDQESFLKYSPQSVNPTEKIIKLIKENLDS